ncbi:hypothetical protein ACF1G0_20095 [Streptomyces sp. NPDC013953]|uniref:VMAP-C domain-containing protein n=1 Tax=Streptomyces sp. NPDC013953 TaxID=3364868 RepID=UPI0036F75880
MTHDSGILPPTLCPERTFALVVGVEKYDLGPRLNLRGPASDALRFAQWLTGPGRVPPANVHLLLSPLSPESLDWTATPGLTELETQQRPATEAQVKGALLGELARCDGDMLWIYWAGHGFLGDRQEMVLVCSDAHEGEIRHLNLDSALRWWRTDKVKRPRFGLQAALVDACRVNEPRNMNPGSTEYGAGKVLAGRRQFQLYACRPGEAAANDPDRGAGRFTEILLDELRRRTPAACITGLAGIAGDIHDRFEELHRKGEAWQLPRFVRDRDWDESSFLDHGLPVPRRAVRLDQSAWDDLGEVFADRPLPRHTYDAYAWAFKVTDCTTPVHQGLPGESLVDIARDLDERQGGRPDIPLTLPFVRFLGARAMTTDQRWGRRLAAWVGRTQHRLRVPALPPPPPPSRSTAVLHLRLDPAAEDEDAYFARIWLRRETTTALWEAEDRPLGLDEVREALARQLKRVRETIGSTARHGGCPDVERIEVHVPFDLLDVPFDQWTVPGRRPGTTRPLGLLHQVVVRCPEERHGTRPVWESKWWWLRTQGGRHREAVRLVRDTELTGTLGLTLGNGTAPACVVADTSGPRTAEVLDATLEGGVPVAVWWRGDGPAGRSTDDAELAALLEPDGDGTPTANVLALPRKVHELRLSRAASRGTAEDSTGRLALLWDDPDGTVHTQSLHGSPASGTSRP